MENRKGYKGNSNSEWVVRCCEGVLGVVKKDDDEREVIEGEASTQRQHQEVRGPPPRRESAEQTHLTLITVAL